MTAAEKALQKLQRQPSDFHWDEARKILRSFGYEEDEGSGGSSVKFSNKDIGATIVIHKPHGGSGGQMPRRSQKRFLEHLKKFGHIDE